MWRFQFEIYQEYAGGWEVSRTLYRLYWSFAMHTPLFLAVVTLARKD